MGERVMLVTGATGALGAAVSRAAAATGARVALAGRDLDKVETQRAALIAAGAEAERLLPLATALASGAVAERLVAQVVARWGGVDVLLNTIGGWRGGQRLAETTDDAWLGMLTLNLHTAFWLSRAVLPHMVSQGWGRIVHVGARAALEPGPKRAAYAVSKAGLVALVANLAADYRGAGITANVVLPGTIDTPANRASMPKADASRWVAPDAIAEAMLFLASEAAGEISGAALPVYGAS
jgi:NAD(P)-dependent dehydrogenase (short-subunit alcohol dehydrogenase family)